jgi:hypothetical protein
MTCENREEGRKEGFLARIAIFSFLFVYCGCFFYFFGCQFQNLCVVLFFAVADCEGFWSKEDENQEEGRKEGFLAGIAIFSFLFVYCGCFSNFFGCQFQNLCVVFFFAVADCEGFWSEGCGTSWFCLLRDRDRTSEATLSTPSFRS